MSNGWVICTEEDCRGDGPVHESREIWEAVCPLCNSERVVIMRAANTDGIVNDSLYQALGK